MLQGVICRLFLEALKYSSAELELQSEHVFYHKQQSDGRNSDLLRKYGLHVKMSITFIHSTVTLAATGVKKSASRQITYSFSYLEGK